MAAAGEPVQRLLAPSVTALSGVTLDGQQLSAAGNWRGPTNSETIASGAHGYELTIGQTSAALVEVRSRPGAL
ncbi:MAG: glycosyl hydrolase family 79 C-terminal domain-containing protein [Solirubrobacteraceae bacterium]